MTTREVDFYEEEFDFDNFELSLSYRFIKRTMDILLSILAMPFVLLLMIIFIPLIKLDSPGPAFFLQERVGLNGKPFKLIKFRSMYHSNDPKRDQVWTQENDPRITRIGKFIRKYRIDEFPQFINVLIGDMSIVGPRPETVYLTNKFTEEKSDFILRTMVKPGITGYAQVNGGYALNFAEKSDLDILYIRKVSILMDLKILFKTVYIVLFGVDYK